MQPRRGSGPDAPQRRAGPEAADAAQADDGVRRWVAASVGPYGAVLADGSEYSGDYGRSDAALRDFHGPRPEVLATSGADLLAIETIPSEQEAAVLLQVLDELPEGTAAGCRSPARTPPRPGGATTSTRVFGLARGHDRVVAVGVNCTAPEHVEELVLRAVAASGKPAVAYPNSGESWDAASRTWGGDGAGVDPAAARPLGGRRGEVRRWLLPRRRHRHRPVGRHDAGQGAGKGRSAGRSATEPPAEPGREPVVQPPVEQVGPGGQAEEAGRPPRRS